MKITMLSTQVSVSDQITVEDVTELANQGVEVLMVNRPDGESSDQPRTDDIQKAAEDAGMTLVNLAFTGNALPKEFIPLFQAQLDTGKRIHAYCRTGNRSTMLWNAAKGIAEQTNAPVSSSYAAKRRFMVVIVGGGSAGLATAASIKKRAINATVAVIEPSEDHYYQPGWTMVGGGAFDPKTTVRKTQDVMPDGVTWVQQSVESFQPKDNAIVLDNGETIVYQQLIVAPGLKLNWDGIEGLSETLGKNGVTSNYRFDLAPYTWELVQALNGGKAIFTQPPMPIKCAGAPQKAMYLSADYWQKQNRCIDIHFYNAGGVLFGVDYYVPALQGYIDKYNADVHFSHNLKKIDGEQKKAWFETTDANGNSQLIETDFDMIHVCPPQCAPDFIRQSELADEAGWLDVNKYNLRHTRFMNVWGVGDVMNTPNAKTMAAARKQAPVVAHNVIDALEGRAPSSLYNGYGSCPLTVENGKIVLAEFGYDGVIMPTFPSWLNDGSQPSKFAWFLKAQVLPSVYWHCMLKGREWLAGPI